MKRFKFFKVAGFILLGIAAIFLFGTITMLLWNALLPGLFHFPVINLWQALGLFALSKLLFGGFRGGGMGRGGRRWKAGMRDKWEQMTPEQRDQFKREFKSRCGWKFPEEKAAE